MECAKRKNKVNFDDKGKNYFFLDSQKFTFYHLFISKAQKGKVKKPQADPFILKGLTGGG